MAQNNQIKLSKHQKLVYEILSKADGHISAYALLDKLRRHGTCAPQQIYRAVEKLIKLGLAHRLESINAFVACKLPDCDTHNSIVFAICNKCAVVTEIVNKHLSNDLLKISNNAGFSVKSSNIELRGFCKDCKAE